MISNSLHHHIRNSIGFTIVELVVVLGVVGMMISIVMPAISRVRESSREAVCLSNMRQIGIGLHNYANTNAGVMWVNSFHVRNGASEFSDFEAYISPKNVTRGPWLSDVAPERIRTGTLREMMEWGFDNTAKGCPSSGYANLYRHYITNTIDFHPLNPDLNNMVVAHRLSHSKDTSAIFLLEHGLGEGADATPLQRAFEPGYFRVWSEYLLPVNRYLIRPDLPGNPGHIAVNRHGRHRSNTLSFDLSGTSRNLQKTPWQAYWDRAVQRHAYMNVRGQ
jgi:Protein of unknown function (DUF1559)